MIGALPLGERDQAAEAAERILRVDAGERPARDGLIAIDADRVEAGLDEDDDGDPGVEPAHELRLGDLLARVGMDRSRAPVGAHDGAHAVRVEACPDREVAAVAECVDGLDGVRRIDQAE